MRTTISLEPDVAKRLKQEMQRTGAPFKQVVNNYLRRGFTTPEPAREPFEVKPLPISLPEGLSFDNIHQLLRELEGPFYR